MANGYKGIGSSEANYSLMATKTAIGTMCGMGGDGLKNIMGKYMDAGIWNKVTGDAVSGSVSQAAQKIVDINSSENKSK